MPPELPGLSGLLEIGRGGFGVVYRAWQPTLDRFVAVKVLSGLWDARAARRFAQECRALGALSGHPNIITIHNTGETPTGEPYLVMPYCERGSLSPYATRPWPEVLDLGVRLAGALHTAHLAGILHRDIKPGNVLIDDYGSPRLADFGQAHGSADETSTSSAFAATPAYAAPEVFSDAPVGPSADVYSLAATLHALIAGGLPFARKSSENVAAVLYRVLHDEPADLREYGAPEPLCAAVEQAMHKDPAQRPRSAAEFGDQLRDAQRALGLQPTPLTIPGESPTSTMPQPHQLQSPTALDRATALDRTASPARSRRRLALLGTGVLAAVAVLVTAVLLLDPGRPVPGTAIAGSNDAPSRTGPAADRAEPPEDSLLLGSDEYGLDDLRVSDNVPSTLRSLFGAPGSTENTAVTDCLGLPVSDIVSREESPRYAKGNPAQAATGSAREQVYAAQSAVLRMSSAQAAAEMVDRWDEDGVERCGTQIRAAALSAVDREPVATPSITGLGALVDLPAEVRYTGHRVDAPYELDNAGAGVADYYADITLIASGDKVLITVLNSFPEAPSEAAELRDAAMLEKLRRD